MKKDKKLVRDSIIDKVSERMKLPRDVVETVVVEQFRGLARAFKEYNSIEMTGFGTWHFLHVRAAAYINYMHKEIAKMKAGEKPKNPQIELENMERDVVLLQNHLDIYVRESQTNSRGLEERSGEKTGSGGDSQTETRDLQHM